MVLAVAFLAMGACEFEASDTARLVTQVRDSAAVGEREVDGARVAISEAEGTTVVRTLNAAWDAAGAGWTIAHDVRLKIGTPRGGDDSEALWRVTSAVLGPDGKVFVANGGSLEVKAFSSDGRLLWITGGKGGGPGEFRRFESLDWCSDSLVVADGRTDRATRLDADGAVIETIPWRRLQRGTRPVSFRCNAVGTLVRIEREVNVPNNAGPYSMVALLAAGTLSETPAILGQVGEFDRYRSGNTDMSAQLGKSVFAAAGDEVLHVLVGDKAEILTYDLQGHLARRSEWDHEATPVTAQMLRDEGAHRSLVLPPDGAPSAVGKFFEGRRASFLATWLEWDHPDFLPVADGLVAATDGDLWIKQFRLYMEASAPEAWWIVSANGALRGVIEIPLGFELLWVGDDAVLGLTQDEEYNHFIELRALLKPGQQGRKSPRSKES